MSPITSLWCFPTAQQVLCALASSGYQKYLWNLCSCHSSCQLSDPELRWVNKKLIQGVVSGWEANWCPGIWHEGCTIWQGHSVSHRFYVYYEFFCIYHISLLTIHPDALETWQQAQEAMEWQHARLPGSCLNAERGPGCKKNHWDENSSVQCYNLSYILSAGCKFCPALQWLMWGFYRLILTFFFFLIGEGQWVLVLTSHVLHHDGDIIVTPHRPSHIPLKEHSGYLYAFKMAGSDIVKLCNVSY